MGKPFYDMTPEELREAGRKGGIKSGEAKRKKKAMKESLSILLNMLMKSGKAVDIEKIKNFTDLKGKNISVQEALLIAQIQKALKGDTAAFAIIRDTLGEKPTEDININMPIVIDGADELED